MLSLSSRFELTINLKYFIKTQNLNQKQAKQTLYLSIFDLTLKHIPEVRMEKANRLSKRLNLKVRVENNNKNQKLIKKEWIKNG